MLGYWEEAVFLPVRLHRFVIGKMIEKHSFVCFCVVCVMCRCTSQLQSPQSVSHHTTSPRLLPTTLAATGEAPLISNNGAAARQPLWAQADPWLYAFARLFFFFFFYSFHVTEIPLRKTSGFNRRLETTIKKKKKSKIKQHSHIRWEYLLKSFRRWQIFEMSQNVLFCFFSYIMSMNGNNPT